MLSMLDADLLGTTMVAVALVAGGALALWSLPWSDEALDEVRREADGVRRHLGGRGRAGEAGESEAGPQAQVAA